MHAKPVESFRLRKIADQSASTTEQTSIGPRQSPQRGESGCAGRRSHSELDCSRGTPLEACGAELPQERYEIDPKQHGTQAPHKNAPRPTHPHTHTHNHTRHLDPLIEASDVDAIAAHVSFEDIPLNLFRERAQSLDELRHPRKRKSKDRLPK